MKIRVIRFALLASVVLTPGRSLPCQQTTDIDPVSVSPDKYKVLLENDHVRVVEYSLKLGERDELRAHPARVSYVVNGGSLRITLGDRSFISNEIAGEVSWRGAVPRHFTENVGATPVRMVLFEVKRIDGAGASPAKDPALVIPSDVRVKLENDSVRVIEALIPPGFKGKTAHASAVRDVCSGWRQRPTAHDGRNIKRPRAQGRSDHLHRQNHALGREHGNVDAAPDSRGAKA